MARTVGMIRTVALLLVALFLAACTTLTPEEQTAAVEVFREMLAAGTITQAQFDTLVAALSEPQGIDWYAIGAPIASLAAAFLGIPIVINKQRGKASAPRGEEARRIAEEVMREAGIEPKPAG